MKNVLIGGMMSFINKETSATIVSPAFRLDTSQQILCMLVASMTRRNFQKVRSVVSLQSLQPNFRAIREAAIHSNLMPSSLVCLSTTFQMFNYWII